VIHDDRREPLAAILVSGEAGFVPDDRLFILGKLVQEVAAELTVTVDSRRSTQNPSEKKSEIAVCSRCASHVVHARSTIQIRNHL
jgi:hypothetical protein